MSKLKIRDVELDLVQDMPIEKLLNDDLYWSADCAVYFTEYDRGFLKPEREVGDILYFTAGTTKYAKTNDLNIDIILDKPFNQAEIIALIKPKVEKYLNLESKQAIEELAESYRIE